MCLKCPALKKKSSISWRLRWLWDKVSARSVPGWARGCSADLATFCATAGEPGGGHVWRTRQHYDTEYVNRPCAQDQETAWLSKPGSYQNTTNISSPSDICHCSSARWQALTSRSCIFSSLSNYFNLPAAKLSPGCRRFRLRYSRKTMFLNSGSLLSLCLLSCLKAHLDTRTVSKVWFLMPSASFHIRDLCFNVHRMIKFPTLGVPSW